MQHVRSARKRIDLLRQEVDSLVKATILHLNPEPNLNYIQRIDVNYLSVCLSGIKYRVQQINGGVR